MQLNLSELQEKQIQFFMQNDSIIEEHHLVKGSKIYVGSKSNRECRFCTKSSKETTFRMLAHALPEFIGNKTLIAYDECDICNARFSRILKDHFAKFLAPARTLGKIPGKKGIPSFKDKNLRIDCKGGELQINLEPGDRVIETKEDTKQISFLVENQPYVPIAIYKCLTKMAISIMPKEELSHFREAIEWILLESHNSTVFNNYRLKCYHAFTYDVKPYTEQINTYLLKRKADTNVPYMIYIVTFANYFFQIVVPCPKLDRQGIPILLEWFPIPGYTSPPYGENKYKILNFSSKDVAQGEFSEISGKYESIE